jgi:hypothetical protein
MILTRPAIAIVISLFLLLAAGVYLANHKVPAHQQKIEKVLSNDRFFK